MNILVSACLMGLPVRYDGRDNERSDILALMDRHHLIPVCAEVFGGLPTPRVPAERKENRVINKFGKDVTQEYVRGAEEIVRLSALYGCTIAILKEKSPSCGHGKIYDGTFSRTLTDGDGVLTERLVQMGIRVVGESEVASLVERGEL